MSLIFEQVLTGGDRNYGYLVGDRDAGVAVAIDPSYRPEYIVERAELQGLKITQIINTHDHLDHTNGNTEVQKLTGAQIARHRISAGEGDRALEEGDTIDVGAYQLRVFHTPGHTQDHIVLFEPKYRLAFTGDHLFIGKIGGTSTEEAAREQYKHLHRILELLPPETTVWSGHNVGCRSVSTLALEKATNPFVMAEDLDAFLQLKNSWSSYKAEHHLI